MLNNVAVKILKKSVTSKLAVIILRFEQTGVNIQYSVQKIHAGWQCRQWNR